ncbi:UNVERIFIED_CONTAM: alsR [Trichonephila clavipes]
MVAEEKHFTRAAARLNMQQPPLSQQIRALEQELGFDLFIRHAKGVDLTVGGEVFLREAHDILQRVSQGALKAARTAKGIEGHLSVGFTSSAASHPLIPRIIRRYRDLYPGVDIGLNEGNAQELTDDVSGGDVDVGILRAPVGNPQGIAYHRLLNEELVLVLPVGHRLLERAGSVSLKDLVDEPLILVRRPGAPGMRRLSRKLTLISMGRHQRAKRNGRHYPGFPGEVCIGERMVRCAVHARWAVKPLASARPPEIGYATVGVGDQALEQYLQRLDIAAAQARGDLLLDRLGQGYFLQRALPALGRQHVQRLSALAFARDEPLALEKQQRRGLHRLAGVGDEGVELIQAQAVADAQYRQHEEGMLVELS